MRIFIGALLLLVMLAGNIIAYFRGAKRNIAYFVMWVVSSILLVIILKEAFQVSNQIIGMAFLVYTGIIITIFVFS